MNVLKSDFTLIPDPEIRVHKRKLFFLISQPKHMFKLMGKKIIAILRKKMFNWPYADTIVPLSPWLGRKCLSDFCGFTTSFVFHQIQFQLLVLEPSVYAESRPRGYKIFSCSTQLSTIFQLHIKTKIPTKEEVYLSC